MRVTFSTPALPRSGQVLPCTCSRAEGDKRIEVEATSLAVGEEIAGVSVSQVLANASVDHTEVRKAPVVIGGD